MNKIVLVVLMAAMALIVGCQTDVESAPNTPLEEIAEPPVAPTPILEIEPMVIEISEEPEYEITIVESEAVALARMAWGEARGCGTMEIAATMWCVLNRVDTTGYGMGNSVEYVISFPDQFHGYSPTYPVTDKLYDLAVDVLTRWQMEKQGASAEEVGRVLPKEYLYFHGDGKQNWFRSTYEHTGEYWDWSLPNPYVEME